MNTTHTDFHEVMRRYRTLSPEARDGVKALVCELPGLLHRAGAPEGMSLQEAADAGLIVSFREVDEAVANLTPEQADVFDAVLDELLAPIATA